MSLSRCESGNGLTDGSTEGSIRDRKLPFTLVDSVAM
jgi:hypothetical protein